jgi:hypothetical protein
MSGLEQGALILVGIWLAAITLALVLVVRQIGLLTVRLSIAVPHYDMDQSGPDVGTELPAKVMQTIGPATPARDVVFFSATCAPCRSLAEGLSKMTATGTPMTAVIAGDEAIARDFSALLPKGTLKLFEPIAGEVAAALKVDSVPFAVRVEGTVVSSKVYLASVEDMHRLEAQAPKRSTALTMSPA